MNDLENRLAEFALGPISGLPESAVIWGADAAEDVRLRAESSGPAALAGSIASSLIELSTAQKHLSPVQLWLPAVACSLSLATSTTEAVEAIAVGVEASTYLLDVLSAVAEWWDVPAIAGSIGASMTVSRLLGLTKRDATATLAFAAASSPRYLVEAGPRLKMFLAHKTAFDAVEAGLAARAGLTAPAAAITGDRGLLAVLGGSEDGTWVGVRLGDVWHSEAMLEELLGAVDVAGASIRSGHDG